MQNNSTLSPYLQHLQSNPESFQVAIERLLEKYRVQPVGSGYIDLILDKERSLNLIAELTGLPAAVENLTWWCNVTLENKLKFGCPHGYGGPVKKYGEGRFSECVQYPDFEISELPDPIDESALSPKVFAEKCNLLATNYIKNILPKESFYSPCLYVGIWIYVPSDWKRKYYAT